MNKKDKLTEATSRALIGKLNEVYIKQYVETFDELYDSSWGPAIEVLDKIAENDLEDALMNWLEDLGTEDAPIDRTDLNDYIIFQSEDIYDALGLDENGDPLDESKKVEAKGSNKTYTCIEDRQHGDFCVGATMTAEEWGETAMGWADSDGWTDPEEPLLKNFKTEQDCINFIDDMWEITIVPSDSPEAKKFLSEARSHKEDNEKVAPRNKEQSFNEGPNKLSNKASGLAVGDKEKANTGVSKVLVGPEKGDIVGRDIKRNRVRSAEQALNRKNAGQLDFGGTTDMQDYEVSPNQKSREYKKAHGMITRENKKVTEAIDENLKAYTVTVSDEENQHSFQFYAEKDKTLDDVFNEIYDYVIF